MTSQNSRPVSLGSQFLAIFNEIEAHFRDVLNQEPNVNFGVPLGQYTAEYRLTNAQFRTLKTMSHLRNAISHSEYHQGRPLAEPVQEVVDEIAAVRDLILQPPLAWDHIPRFEPCVTTSSAPIRRALAQMHQQDFSQIPVYDDRRYAGLLTTNCVARWFAAELSRHSVNSDAVVAAIMKFAEHQDRAVHVPKAITAVEAIDRLSESDDQGYRPAALVMTRTGIPDERVLAVIVDFDLPALSAAVAVPHRVRSR